MIEDCRFCSSRYVEENFPYKIMIHIDNEEKYNSIIEWCNIQQTLIVLNYYMSVSFFKEERSGYEYPDIFSIYFQDSKTAVLFKMVYK